MRRRTTSSRPGHEARALTGAAALALMVLASWVPASGCSPENGADSNAPELVWTDDPPSQVARWQSDTASQGDLWVVANVGRYSDGAAPDRSEAWFAARRSDGRWAELPDAPGPYRSAALASVGGHAVLAGVVCDDDSDCSSGRVEWSRLAADLRSWELLDATEDFAGDRDTRTGVRAVSGRNDFGVFRTPAGRYSLDSDGAVRIVPTNAGSSPLGGSACVVGSILVESSVADQGSAFSEQGDTVVSTFDLTAPEDGWSDAPPAPPEVELDAAAQCLDNGMGFLRDGVETEFDVDSRTWTAHPGPAEPLLIGRSFDPQLPGVLAADGSLFVLTSRGSTVLRRAPDGAWSDTGVVADRLSSTADQILASQPDGLDASEVVEVPLG